MTRVLVTGASGFIGVHAVEALLEAGHEVHAVSTTRRAIAGAAWHVADLLDPASIESLLAAARPENLLHLAWYAEHGSFWTSPENVRWVEATLHLLRSFHEIGGRRAALAGTCAEYAWGYGRCVEERPPDAASDAPPAILPAPTPLAPATLYGAAKHATHLVAEAYGREIGLELAWGRIFFLYGPREAPGRLVPSVARALLTGQEAATTAGTQVRDFMHVADVARAFVALLDSAVCGAVNIASGEGIAIADLVRLVAEQAGRPELLRVGALPQRPGEPPELVADATRLSEDVGFTPRFTLTTGVADTVEWWRARLADTIATRDAVQPRPAHLAR